MEEFEPQEHQMSLPAHTGYDIDNSTRATAAPPNIIIGGSTSSSGGATTRKTSGSAKATTASSSLIRYRECLKNHAVSIGGHAVDGCGEFLPAGNDGTLDALRCAACNCHRNFHRKDYYDAGYQMPQFPSHFRSPAGYMLAASGVAHRPGDAEEEDLSRGSRKRFRTKFSQEQKEKMLSFAESLGWRIQKHDEGAVQQFCSESGVKRHVLKVWMHNNKHTLGKKV